MSKPKTDHNEPHHGAACELISAMSALNMGPEPLQNPPKDAIYLSELDAMAAHSYEHMEVAFEYVRDAETEYKIAIHAIDRALYNLQDGGGLGLNLDATPNELIEALVAESIKIRKERKQVKEQ